MNKATKLHFFCRILIWLTLICGVIQFFIDNSYNNIYCTTCTLISSVAVFQYIKNERIFVDTPISTLAILGLLVTTEYSSLVAQTLSLNSLVDLLRTPVLTFSVLSVALLIALATHWVYRHLRATMACRDALTENIFQRIGAIEAPRVEIVWLIAIVGAASSVVGSAKTGDVGGKLVEAFTYLQWLPFTIPLFHKKYGRDYCDMKKHLPFIILYILILAAIGLIRNARQLMLIGPVQLAIMFLIYTLQENKQVTKRTYIRTGALIAASWLFITIFSDFAIAMVVAREKIRELSPTPTQMISESVATFFEPEKIRDYKEKFKLASKINIYDEYYITNPVIARFSETKFHDNALFFSSNLNEAQRGEFIDTTLIKIIATLPQNILDALDIKISKDKYFYSMGDYYRYLYEGPSALGGFATGSIWADMIVIFDVWAPLVAAGMFMLIFILFDAPTIRGEIFQISPVILCSTWPILIYGLGGESFAGKIGALFREMPQKFIIYTILTHSLKILLPSKGANINNPRL